jgi:dolichol-phosphate mannosyltransferase
VTDLARVLVVVPTYNERPNVEKIVQRTLQAVPAAHVLVVDDGSPDGTGDVADELALGDDRVHVLHRAAKAGLGAAYVAGFGWGLARAYDVFVEMDADGSHQPEQLPELLAALDEADLVLGSRWVPGGTVENWPRRREVLSRGGNTYVRLALERLDLATVSSQGYCFQVDLAMRAVAAGLRVREVPIRFVERVEGTSKMSGAIVREALWRVTVWGAERRGREIRRALRRR